MIRRIGLYPGTFDPITNGHADIIQRALGLVDHLVVAVAENAGKGPLFTCDERTQMVEEELAAMTMPKGVTVEVKHFQNLLVDFAREQHAEVIIRGLRAVADFEYEYQMAGMNQQINAGIETIFLMADVGLQPIASKLVKEIALFGGDIANFVSPAVRVDVMARVEKLGRLGDL